MISPDSARARTRLDDAKTGAGAQACGALVLSEPMCPQRVIRNVSFVLASLGFSALFVVAGTYCEAWLALIAVLALAPSVFLAVAFALLESFEDWGIATRVLVAVFVVLLAPLVAGFVATVVLAGHCVEL